ncbi:MAG: hypothetical protein CGU28_14555 [Candidatus Dactylopiibacterium carminicum]|uniref:Fimbrial assembly protein n=1 Tax=Candidatus Dactylopiibacterium carminicum TaxID=857335 RepID=A0A272ER92_9RHOO|nr:hypothetical protein [Candidatus Dactylopiibacterium carminicum]KAF7598754.1 hypothetical protein BGI27_11490 [Candidatus Dactylopiibacterium carminicum]PAS92592.1 MAG: hypothetical protein CGU29_10920 [Candidatus Dactylopiibacterium carminicum]PAS93892.1 MAG: hypothetical protein CGU28_14555 [Candidatus Dactylopiibacterium carminicum]PAS98775.1 MAG: hypothetical protein BSR46_11505 [Candidatus Dactylopiibacterium carminicum]
MKPLPLEFAHRGPGGQLSRRMRHVLAAVLALLLVLSVLGAWMGRQLGNEARSLGEEGFHLRADRELLIKAARHQAALPADMVDSINGVIRLLDYPLIDLLERLEAHAGDDVRLLSLEMGAVRTSVRLVVQAPALSVVLDYLDALRKEPGFENLVLVRQEAPGNDGAGLRFTLEMPQMDAVPRANARLPDGGSE